MSRRRLKFWGAIALLIAGICSADAAWAQEHHHGHGAESEAPVSRPQVYLDKSPRIVQYQLGRLDNERLLLVERATDDPKYEPVFTAILLRAGMARQDRDEALHGLMVLNESDATAELLAALGTLKTDDREQKRVAKQLAEMLLDQPAEKLAAQSDLLTSATESKQPFLRTVGYAGLMTAGKLDETPIAEQAQLDWLAGIALVPREEVRAKQFDAVAQLVDEANPAAVREAAVAALAFVPEKAEERFRLVAPLVEEQPFRQTAIRTLLSIPKESRPGDLAAPLVDTLVALAEATPAEDRTSNDFIDAMQLTDQLLARLPADDARAYRQRLREVTVRVVRIRTVQEEMRYDTPYFAVEAGRPVQVVLQNEDLMPHNFVITVQGALQEVAIAGAELGMMPGFEGKAYIPDSDKVLHATDMVQANQQVRLTFTAPTEPGEYPYVCTFPRHWMRMYGVMIVVEDLDAWLQNPTVPEDPIGSTRAFVQSWTIDDFADEMEIGLRGRTTDIGRRIFEEATCAQCHKVNGQGGAVGPELADVFHRWKGDRLGVLREILDPSHKIDPKYTVQLVVTTDGEVFTGIVQSEDKSSVTLITNPESPTPTVVKRDDIDEIVKSSVSMMPKALLDRFSKDEVFELLAYLQEVNAATAAGSASAAQ